MPVTKYVWSRDKVTMEKDETGTTTKTYTQGVGQYGPLISENSGSGPHYYHFDALGSTRAMTDENEDVTDTFVYDAWGNTKASTGFSDTSVRFVGKYGYQFNNKTGTYYIRSRSYDSLVANWSSTDPLFIISPLGNQYAYCNNIPTRIVDPSGLDRYISRFCDTAGDAADFLVSWHPYVAVDVWACVTKCDAKGQCFPEFVRTGTMIFSFRPNRWWIIEAIVSAPGVIEFYPAPLENGQPNPRLVGPGRVTFETNPCEDILMLERLVKDALKPPNYSAPFYNCWHWAIDVLVVGLEEGKPANDEICSSKCICDYGPHGYRTFDPGGVITTLPAGFSGGGGSSGSW